MRRDDVDLRLLAGRAYQPYKRALLDEIPRSGLRVASLFSGVGGSSFGYRLAGFDVAYANEFAPRAAESYRANASPTTYVDERDVRTIRGEEIVEICDGVPDVLDGSPPCSPFSMIGKGTRDWGKETLYTKGIVQRTDDLLWEYARLVEEIRPPVLVLENVNSLTFGSSRGFFKKILRRLDDADYEVRATVIDASLLGTPTRRRRLIFVGTDRRRSLPPPPEIPPASDHGTPFSTVSSTRWWVSHRPQRANSKGSTKRRTILTLNPERPLPTVTTIGVSDVPFHFVATVDDVRVDRDGYGLEASLTPHLKAALRGWADGDLLPRMIGLIEIIPASGFPVDVALTGTHIDQWERIGRAVPPTAMARVAAEIVDQVFDR